MTAAPHTEIEPVRPTVAKKDRTDLGVSIYSAIDQALGDRSQLDTNLDYYTSLYEMEVGEKNWPWPNSANVFIPLIPTQLDTLAARLTATVFPPRMFLVNGNTDEAAKYQHEVERYYNAELARHDWNEKFYQWMHLSLRDGTALLKVTWKRQKRKRKVVQAVDAKDENGSPIPDQENPDQPHRTTEVKEIEVTEYDDVVLTPVELRDFLVLPAYAKSIEEAAGVAHKLYLDETQLRAMAYGEDAVLWPDAVKSILETVDEGNDEVAMDRQGISTLTAAGQINVSDNNGEPPSKGHQAKGPFIVWEVYRDDLDLDGDGVPEENVFWVHDSTQTLLGVDSYQYWHGQRPFISLAPMPRLRRFYGYSVVERLRTIQEEINALHNKRLDAVDLALLPPRYRTENASVKDQNKKWAPDAEWVVTNKEDVGFINGPTIPLESKDAENTLNSYAERLTGLSAPMVGGTNSGRRTAKEVQTAASSAGVRLDLMAARIRQAMKLVFWQIHHLKLQFAPDNMESNVNTGGAPEKLSLPKAKLAQDYDLSIAGMGGPVDKQGRQQSMLFLYSLLMKNPIVAQDKMKVYRVTRMLLEEYDRVDIPSLLGTEEDQKKQMEAEQQAQQKMQQQAMQEHAQLHQAALQATLNGHAPPQPQKPQAPQQSAGSAGPKLAA